MFDLAPVPLLLLTPDLVVVHANRALLAATGRILRGSTGRPLVDVLPSTGPGAFAAEGWSPLLRSLERARDAGRPDDLAVQRYVLTVEGQTAERFWSHRTVPLLDDRGAVVLLVHRADDVTSAVRSRHRPGAPALRDIPLAERVRRAESDLALRTRELAEAEAGLRALAARKRRAAQQLSGLATTVSALSVAETRGELLRQVFGHGRRALGADVLAVALFEPGGSHLAVVDDRGGADGPRRRVPASSPALVAAAAAGRTVVQPDAAGTTGAPPLPGVRAWAALPLRVGRRPLGSITVGWEDPQTFDDEDVQVFEAFAAECAQAVHRVARRETERRQARATRTLAESLQRALLTSPPHLEHLTVAVRYRPAAREVQIGGDWYDAFPSPDGATTLVVGDVTGHDWTAAAVAGQLRNMLRGIASALDHRDPDQVLTALDRALHETGIQTLATAIIARIEMPTGDGTRLLRWSNAGHPPPLLLAPDGTAALLERQVNLLLGVTPDAPRRHHTVVLPPGSTVVLYTDGLVEHRDATLDAGLGRLLALGPAVAGRPVGELCDELLDRMEPDLTDDIALLAVRIPDDRAR